MNEGLEMHDGQRHGLARTMSLSMFAEAEAKRGQPDKALQSLEEALGVARESAVQHFLSELHRLLAVLTLERGNSLDGEQAENCCKESIAGAKR